VAAPLLTQGAGPAGGGIGSPLTWAAALPGRSGHGGRARLRPTHSGAFEVGFIMPEKVLYTAEAISTGDGRNGHVTSPDGRIDLDLALPPEMGGSGDGANPEELFAAGYAACYHSALRAIARRTGVDVDGSTVKAYIGIGPDGDAFDLVATLEIYLPKASPEQAREAADAAHQVCPYSRATRGNISVELRLTGPAATTEQPA